MQAVNPFTGPASWGKRLRLMLDEQFMAYARRVREQAYRLGAPVLEEEEAVQVYGIVFTYAAAVSERLTALDLGAGVGYASLWIAKALDDACRVPCRLVAVEKSRRLAEKASTVLHSYPFRRVSLRVVHGEPLRFLESVEKYSVDLALVNTGKASYVDAVALLETRMVIGGVAFLAGAYAPGLPEELYEVTSRPAWRRTILPVGRGVLVLVRVEAAGEGEEAG